MAARRGRGGALREYLVEVVIQNKAMAKDPEGETIERDLIHRGGYGSIRAVRSGKYLRMLVRAESPGEAKGAVVKMCNELRLFNPVVHSCSVKVRSIGARGLEG